MPIGIGIGIQPQLLVQVPATGLPANGITTDDGVTGITLDDGVTFVTQD